MLKIRAEQIPVFDSMLRLEFIEQVLSHLEKFMPDKILFADTDELLHDIQAGIRSAQRHGFETGYQIGLYLDIVCLFGPDFDRNPETRWAADILRDSSLQDPAVRINRLYDAAILHQNSAPMNS